jgi:hypothetical protein
MKTPVLFVLVVWVYWLSPRNIAARSTFNVVVSKVQDGTDYPFYTVGLVQSAIFLISSSAFIYQVRPSIAAGKLLHLTMLRKG